MAPTDLYSANAETIEAAIAYTCRTHRLTPEARDEFGSWARLRLIDHDCAILAKFQGRSSLRTFLITVVQRLFLDWRNAEWGKWRPSSEARRLGPVAIGLERLILRDRQTFDEAVHVLIGSGVAASVEECDQLWSRLPQRPRRRHVGDEVLQMVPAAPAASDGIEDRDADAKAVQLAKALSEAVVALPPRDQLLLRLTYWDGLPISRIARTSGEDQKGLYRRVHQLRLRLRANLEAGGWSAADLEVLMGRIGGGGDGDE